MIKHLIEYRDRFYDILKSRNIPDTLLKAIVGIYTQKISVKFSFKSSKLAEINKGVCQGCPFSPTLFNIDLD
jgi:hypothetical protein